MSVGHRENQQSWPLELGKGAKTLYGARRMPTSVCAHITGTVWKIEVKEGDEIMEGQTCVILESMKMEMPVEAPASGKVEKISCSEGQAVNEGDVLLTLA
jgi:acetyl-CoA carboxylase biotin carboxyl carrier protein